MLEVTDAAIGSGVGEAVWLPPTAEIEWVGSVVVTVRGEASTWLVLINGVGSVVPTPTGSTSCVVPTPVPTATCTVKADGVIWPA